MNRRHLSSEASDPALVRLLEQLTTYAAALDHADAPVLARLMRATCDKLRSQHDKAVALGRLNDDLSSALAPAANAVAERDEVAERERQDAVASWARSLAAVAALFPSKPAALNADPPAETSEVGPARISTSTPIQGRDDDDDDSELGPELCRLCCEEIGTAPWEVVGSNFLNMCQRCFEGDGGALYRGELS